LIGTTQKAWWCSLLWSGDRGSARRLIASNALGLVLFFLWASYPAAAAGEELRVIAVHTASAPHVSMVVQPPATPPGNESDEESCTVTIDGKPVTTTLTPMASSDLSVALVIDTASDLTAQELRSVKNGAIDFLLGLPQEANSMVVTAGGQPQIVAPLNTHPAEALSAISALEVGGSRATSAATRLAAESLQSAPPGPRVIIVYTGGPDEQDPSVEQLSEAVLQAHAVVNVIPTSAESTWPSVVNRTGGVVLPPIDTADIAAAFGRLATMLDEQYLVTFQAPDELPAEAQVAFQSGDQEYRTVVDLPDADTEQAASTESSRPSAAGSIARLVSTVVAGLVLIALTVLALVLSTRRWAAMASSPPAEAAGPQPSTPPPPAPAMSATEKEGGDSASTVAPSSTPATALATSALPPRSRRGALSAAVQGRRSAEQALNSAPEQQVRQPPEDQQPPAAPDAKQAPQTKDAARPQAAMTSTEPPKSTRPSEVAPKTAIPARAEQQHGAPERHDMKTVLTGSGDGEIELIKTALGPAVVHISGNSDSQYFAVRTLGTNNVLVMTMEPFEGARPLDWDGDESSGFKIWATGPWRIEMLPLSAIPTFTDSFNGNGNMVVHYTGTGSRVRITGNNEGQHLEVWALSTYGPYRRLVDTNQPCAEEYQISQGRQIFEVQATGSWTITIT
jgi:von Willebrand factor type A domain